YLRLLLLYTAVGVLLWPVPLLGILHAESSALVATVAFFGAGSTSRSMLRSGITLPPVIVLQESALLIPWLLLTMSAIWRPNCGYMQGLMLYILFAGISVLLAVALMSFLLEAHERSSHRVFWVVGILIGVLPPLYDIGFHPQFYTYNHVFGGVLGPIYDEQLAIRSRLFVFRLLTLLWVGFLLLLRRLLRDNRGTVLIGFVALLIGAAYAQPAELGFVTTRDKLRRALPGTRLTDHFEIRYDPRVISDTEISQIAGDHEFRYEQMSRRLQETVSGRIETYIYPDPEVK